VWYASDKDSKHGAFRVNIDGVLATGSSENNGYVNEAFLWCQELEPREHILTISNVEEGKYLTVDYVACVLVMLPRLLMPIRLLQVSPSCCKHRRVSSSRPYCFDFLIAQLRIQIAIAGLARKFWHLEPNGNNTVSLAIGEPGTTEEWSSNWLVCGNNHGRNCSDSSGYVDVSHPTRPPTACCKQAGRPRLRTIGHARNWN